MAELDYPRTTGTGATSTSVIGAPSVFSMTNAVVSSPSSHVLPNVDCTLGITGNMASSNVADITSSTLGHVSWAGPRLTTTNAQQQISNMMPSISQVRDLFTTTFYSANISTFYSANIYS